MKDEYSSYEVMIGFQESSGAPVVAHSRRSTYPRHSHPHIPRCTTVAFPHCMNHRKALLLSSCNTTSHLAAILSSHLPPCCHSFQHHMFIPSRPSLAANNSLHSNHHPSPQACCLSSESAVKPHLFFMAPPQPSSRPYHLLLLHSCCVRAATLSYTPESPHTASSNSQPTSLHSV